MDGFSQDPTCSNNILDFLIQWDCQGPPIKGPLYLVSFPYYSHTVRETYHKEVPLLGVPGITLDIPCPCQTFICALPFSKGHWSRHLLACCCLICSACSFLQIHLPQTLVTLEGCTTFVGSNTGGVFRHVQRPRAPPSQGPDKLSCDVMSIPLFLDRHD